jgi:ELWxxDGT repeat protein
MSTCHRLPYFAAVLAIASIAAGALSAAELPAPFLAGDFAAGADPGYFEPQEMAAIGGKIYFSGIDPDQGREPWVSDGSAAGTRRLGDLCYGECGSYPSGFAAAGGSVVFRAMNSLDRAAVYRLEADGGIHEILSFDYDIPEWAPLGSTVFFATRYGEVFRTDGTREGTRLIAQLGPHPSFELPQKMAAVNGAVYYADAGKLYRIAENDEAPQAIFTFDAGPAPWPEVVAYQAIDAGRFMFSLCGPHGETVQCRAWASDGSAAGIRSLETDGQLNESDGNFVAFGGRVYSRPTITSPSPTTAFCRPMARRRALASRPGPGSTPPCSGLLPATSSSPLSKGSTHGTRPASTATSRTGASSRPWECSATGCWSPGEKAAAAIRPGPASPASRFPTARPRAASTCARAGRSAERCLMERFIAALPDREAGASCGATAAWPERSW